MDLDPQVLTISLAREQVEEGLQYEGKLPKLPKW
jgi:hypothetical protein